MGFLSGQVTVRRYSVPAVEAFQEDVIDRLREYSADKRTMIGEGDKAVEIGFLSNEDYLATNFSFAKQVKGEFLLFSFRVTKTKIPAKDIKAQARVELEALVAGGKPDIPRIRKEARENAMAYLEERAKDGRWTTHAVIPVVWDKCGELWYGASAHTHGTAFETLFERAFGVRPMEVTPESVAKANGVKGLPDLGDRPAWLAESEAYSEWGNRFALWLARTAMAGEDTVGVGGEEVTFMVSNKLVMDCPKESASHTGRDTFKHDVPVRMPEVKEAVRLGKMPTSIGLELVATEDHYKCVLDPHRWVVTGLSLPKAEDGKKAEKEMARMFAIRRFLKVLDQFLVTYLVEYVGDETDAEGGDA